MTFDEVLVALRTVPYRRVKSMTVSMSGCMCAQGAMLKAAGYETVRHTHKEGVLMEDIWKKDGKIYQITSCGKVSEHLHLSLSFCREIEHMSDSEGLVGPAIADRLEERREHWKVEIQVHQRIYPPRLSGEICI